MSFGFLGKIAQTVGHDVSVVARGNNKPGGGVFGFLNQAAQQAVNPVSKVANEARALPAVITGNNQAAQNILGPGGGFGHQGGVLGGAELGNDAVFLGPNAVQNIKKTVGTGVSIGSNLAAPGAATGETLAAKAVSGAVKGAPLGFLASAGQQLGDNQPLNFKQLTEGAAAGALLGTAPVVGRVIANIDRKVGEAVPATKNLSVSKVGMSTENVSPDVHIETPQGTIRIAAHEMEALQKATTPAEVRQVIGDALPTQIVDKLSRSIPNTKDPHIISNLISREVSPPLPRSTEGIVPTPVTPTEEATGQGALGNLGQSEAAKQITDTLAEAQKTRALQEQGYSVERSQRIGRAQGVDSSLTGSERYRAKLAQLEGPLAKQEYEGLAGHLSPTDQENLFTQVQKEIEAHPELQGYAGINAETAVRKVIFGRQGVPTNSELGLLAKLDPGLAKAAQQDVIDHNERLTAMKTIGQKAGDVIGVMRALETTGDFSGGFRQALAAATRHPITFAKEFKNQFKYFKSEEDYNTAQKAIEDDPNFPLMLQGKLAIQRVGDAPPSAKEEQFVSSLAERLPGIGRVVKASNRAYTGLLNNMRANMFNQLAYTARMAGHDLNSPESLKLLKDIATVVNTSTGRGNLGRFEAAGHALTTALFAPRLIASRLSMLDPRYYINLEPIARREALQTLVSLGAFGTAVLGAAELAGAKVNKDPTNADFGKVRIGDTRLDPLAGFSQYIRLGAQIAEGKKTSSTTGATVELGKGLAASRWDVFSNFIINKASPQVSLGVEALKGKDAAGNPVDYKKELKNRFTPLLSQDIQDLYTHDNAVGGSQIGKPLAIAGGVFGLGVQTYSSQDNPLSAKQKTYIQTLKDNGASKEEIQASTRFFQSLKEASGTRTNVNTAIDKALATNDLPKAQQLAEQYNKELAAGIHAWNQKYGQYATNDLQDAYDRQKINLSPTSINSRLKSIHSTKPF